MMLRVPWDRSGRRLAGRTEPRAQATGPGAPRWRLGLGLWAALAALIGLSDFPAAAREDSPPWLEPTWTCRIEAGIEWAAAVGRGDTSAVLVATPAGELHLIDLYAGKPRLTETLRASRGVRPAEGNDSADVAYCFDRHAAYAIRLTEPAGLQWRYGQALAPAEEFQGDPENLAGWTDARVTRAGLLLANVDGRVVLLSHADGQPRWELPLGRMPLARLHARDNAAAVVWKSGGTVRAAFLALDKEDSQAICRDLGDTWPVWSDLVPEGLLAVSAHEATLWPADGPPRVTPLHISDLRAQAVVAWTPAQGTCLLVGDGAQVVAHDVATGRERWRESAARFRGFKVLSLAIHDDRVVVTSEFGVSVRDAATGRLLADCPLLPTIEVMARWISGLEVLYVAYHSSGQPSPALALARVELPLPGTRVVSGDAPSSTFEIRSTGEIRQVLWSGQHIVLVAPNGLRAYTLP